MDLRTQWTTFILVATSLTAPLLAEIPERREDRRAGMAPIWVSESSAVDEEGRLRKELFEPSVAGSLGDPDATPGARVGPCAVNLLQPPIEQFVELGSLDTLARNSTDVFIGEVVELRQGFLVGMPGTLYAIRPTVVLSRDPLATELYVFISQARIPLHFGDICSTVSPETVIPRVGDRILAFLYLEAYDPEKTIYRVDPQRQLIVERRGRVLVPSALTDQLPTGDLDAIAAIVREKRGTRSRESMQ